MQWLAPDRVWGLLQDRPEKKVEAEEEEEQGQEQEQEQERSDSSLGGMNSRRSSTVGPGSPGNSSGQEGEPFLLVQVTDPVKLGNGVQAYVSYKVSSKTNMLEYRGPEKIVIRRYSDFVWLHDRLLEKYKGVIIPPLPEKSAVEKFRFSSEFIEIRRKALDVYANRIAAHPLLRASEDLRNFLQADEEIWSMERAKTHDGVFKRKPSEFMQMFKDVQSKVSDVVLGKEKPVEELDPENEKWKRYVVELEEHTAEVQKQSFRLVKRLKDSGAALEGFGKSSKGLGSCEEQPLGKAFQELGSRAEQVSYKMQQQAQDVLMNFEEPLKELVRTIQASKVVLADRALAYKTYRELADACKLKELNLEKLRVLRADKVHDAEIELREMVIQCDEAKARYDSIVRLMAQEIVRFQESKTRDLGLVLHDFAQEQAAFHVELANIWRSLLPTLSVNGTADSKAPVST